MDYGHELKADINYYPGINETTTMSVNNLAGVDENTVR